MKLHWVIIIFLFIIFVYSCTNKNIDGHENTKNMVSGNHSQALTFQPFEKVEMIYPIEYYKEEIFKDQANYRNTTINELEKNILSISSMVIIENIIPNLLTFLVTWSDIRGYIYYFYTFDENQKIFNRHFCGFLRLPRTHRQKLMENIPGKIIEDELISIGDFNDDGINEILSYAWYPNIGDVFTIYGFCFIENTIINLCQVPVFINYENPFSSVEYIGNGFRILEIIDEKVMDLAWSEYTWNNNIKKYIRK